MICKLIIALVLFSAIATGATIDRVIDGDTVVMNNGERVRLIGVDAPEIGQPGAEAAALFLRDLTINSDVDLEYDSEADSIDIYGRTLAYLRLDDGRCANAELIRQGYCKVLRGYPFSRKSEFLSYEREARTRGTRIWADVPRDSVETPARCQATTRKGTQCKRNAQLGTDYCWQHKE